MDIGAQDTVLAISLLIATVQTFYIASKRAPSLNSVPEEVSETEFVYSVFGASALTTMGYTVGYFAVFESIPQWSGIYSIKLCGFVGCILLASKFVASGPDRSSS